MDNEIIGEKKEKKKNKLPIILIVISLVCIVGGGTYYFFSNNRSDTKNVDTKKQAYSKYRLKDNSLADFDLSFLQIENQNKNMIYSPLSIKYALNMLKEGANGETRDQITAVVGDYKSNRYVNSKNLSLANALFVKEDFLSKIKSSYIYTISDKYDAAVETDDFKNATVINKWVNDKTLGLINNIIDDGTAQSLDYALINALAINMEWKNVIQANADHDEHLYSVHFDHENYADHIGYLEETGYNNLKFDNKYDSSSLEIGASINKYDIVKTLGEENIRKTITEEYTKWLDENKEMVSMNPEYYETDVNKYVTTFINELKKNYGKTEISTDFMFYDDDNVKAFAKDLKEYNGTTLQYIGIMPKKENLSDFVDNTNANDLSKIISNLKDINIDNFEEGYVTKIKGYIPIFNFDYELKLTDDLKTLGIKNVFEKNMSDLTGIADDKLYISTAIHKANIDFSNEGIKASAATILGGLGAAGGGYDHLYEVPVKEIDMTFDKPFMFLIRDKKTGEVWFTGNVYEPLTWQEYKMK